MRPCYGFLFAFATFLLEWLCCAAHEVKANERLTVSPLKNGNILTNFQFSASGYSASERGAELQLIPGLFRHLLDEHEIDELELSFAQGFWRDDVWGNRRGVSAPSGTQLLVHFDGNPDSVDRRWTQLLRQINGLFCASMLEMDPTLTSAPRLFVQGSEVDLNWRYGSLPSETLCSENLKSWTKLLPCKQHGLVSLLEPRNLLMSGFHALTLRVTRKQESEVTEWQFLLNAITVHPERHREKPYWSLQNLFAKNLVTKCPVMSSSVVLVEKCAWEMEPNPDAEMTVDNVAYHLYNLSAWIGGAPFGITARVAKDHYGNNLLDASSRIGVQSYFISTSQSMGGLITRITNRLPVDLPIVFSQMIPWKIRVYLHTLSVRCRPSNSKHYTDVSQSRRYIQLAQDLAKPLLVEFVAELPAESICEVSADYEAAFLKITSFPADANSGVYVPGPIITVLPPANNTTFLSSQEMLAGMRLYGEPLLILLPVPDFSMPFNVIVIVCSLIATFYGNVFTLTTKLMKPVLKKELADKKKEAGPSTLRQKLSALLGRVRNVFSVKAKAE